jgi:hypothetical protein
VQQSQTTVLGSGGGKGEQGNKGGARGGFSIQQHLALELVKKLTRLDLVKEMVTEQQSLFRNQQLMLNNTSLNIGPAQQQTDALFK